MEFSTGVFHTEYKDDLIDDIDGGSPADNNTSAGGYTPIDWVIVH